MCACPIGTRGSAFDCRIVSEVRTLPTLSVAVSVSMTKFWNVRSVSVMQKRTKSTSPDTIHASRTTGHSRMRSSKPTSSASVWFLSPTNANAVRSQPSSFSSSSVR